MDGIEVLRRIRALADPPPVAVLTAVPTSANTIEAMRLGAADHVAKPIGREDLMALLARMLSGFEMFDPTMQFPDWPGSHPGVQCQFYLPLISWMLGYPDRSLEEAPAAVKSAETLGHPVTRPNAVLGCARSHLLPRAIGGRRLCRTGFADLRGAAHRAVPRPCPL
jgi:hypothetical protein